MEQNGTLEWDVKTLSKALKLNEAEIIEIYKDGRSVHLILKRDFIKIMNGKNAPKANLPYKLEDENGKKWDIKSITKNVNLPKSSNTGMDRPFDENELLRKINSIDGYIFVDLNSFPKTPYWLVPSSIVLKWYEAGKISKSGTISHKKIIKLIEDI